MDSPVERHQVIFLNPDLAGLYTAYLSHRAGARVAIVDETQTHEINVAKYPPAFPAAGTFHPHDVDMLATDSGFMPPIWERVPLLRLHVAKRKIVLNSDDGPGGMILAIGQAFPTGRSIWTDWFQEQLKKAEELLQRADKRRMGKFRMVEKSVADAVGRLRLPEAESFLFFLDALCIVTVGRGVIQLDQRDFPIVLAGFLTGWHIPARDEKDWREIIKRRLQKEGALCQKVTSVASVQLLGKRMNVVRCSDGHLKAAQILVVPESDRYRHPSEPTDRDAAGSIRWMSWFGRVDGHSEKQSVVGVINASDRRPPINDNFITYHLRPGKKSLLTVSAPVEARYFAGGARQLASIAQVARHLLEHRLVWAIESLTHDLGDPAGPEITLPGAAPSLSYPEGPLWGDDIFARLKAADRLSRHLVERLK